MFVPDLARAVAECRRVLAPGGRLCSAVWIEPGANPWTEPMVAAVALPVPDPDGPSMFRCAAPGCLGDRYERAGFHDVAEWDVGVELVVRSAEAYWEMMSEHVSLVAAAQRRAARARMRDHAIAAVAPYARDGHVRAPGPAASSGPSPARPPPDRRRQGVAARVGA